MTWSRTEIGILVRAAGRAPSVHNTQPWLVQPRDSAIELYESRRNPLPQHDPLGRDRMISCGAAAANLVVAARAAGWEAALEPFADEQRPDLVATVRAGSRKEPGLADATSYAAMLTRRSRREPFALRRVSPARIRDLIAAAGPGTQVRLIDRRTEAAPLAELLGYAASVLRDDRAYQRELTAWAGDFPEAFPAESSLPWAGLVHPGVHLPDRITLTSRLARENLLLVLTPDDSRQDHFAAGVSMQRIWLAAVAQGLAASVITQPLHLAEVRSGLIERLQLAGYPQLLLRVGHPVTEPARLPLTSLPVQEESR